MAPYAKQDSNRQRGYSGGCKYPFALETNNCFIVSDDMGRVAPRSDQKINHRLPWVFARLHDDDDDDDDERMNFNVAYR